jgi:hypothetical protein
MIVPFFDPLDLFFCPSKLLSSWGISRAGHNGHYIIVQNAKTYKRGGSEVEYAS